MSPREPEIDDFFKKKASLTLENPKLTSALHFQYFERFRVF